MHSQQPFGSPFVLTLAWSLVALTSIADGALAGPLAAVLPEGQNLAHLSLVGSAFVLPAIVTGAILAVRRVARAIGMGWCLMTLGSGLLAGNWLASGSPSSFLHALFDVVRSTVT